MAAHKAQVFTAVLLALALLIASLIILRDDAGARSARSCPYTMGEPCPRDYGLRLCPTLAYDIATAADVYDVDFIMHSAGCNQRPSGAWVKRTGDNAPNTICSRRAYWLVDHGYSILRTREMLSTRGCGQFEDGTYYAY